MDKISWLAKQIIRLNAKQEPKYLLTVFETVIVPERIKRDFFDLQRLYNLYVTNQEAKENDLLKSINFSSFC